MYCYDHWNCGHVVVFRRFQSQWVKEFALSMCPDIQTIRTQPIIIRIHWKLFTAEHCSQIDKKLFFTNKIWCKINDICRYFRPFVCYSRQVVHYMLNTLMRMRNFESPLLCTLFRLLCSFSRSNAQPNTLTIVENAWNQCIVCCVFDNDNAALLQRCNAVLAAAAAATAAVIDLHPSPTGQCYALFALRRRRQQRLSASIFGEQRPKRWKCVRSLVYKRGIIIEYVCVQRRRGEVEFRVL